MAPFRDESDDVPFALPDETFRSKEDAALVDGGSGHGKPFAQEETVAPCNESMTMGFESSTPESILRRPKYSTADGDADKFTALAHGPRPQTIHRRSVHFPPATSVVTSVRTRPRTHVLDVPSLYYSPEDTRRFKREYRQLLRSQTAARERMEWNSRQKLDGSSEDVGKRPQPQHDNSFWRSKVGRRWSSTATASNSDRKNGHTAAAPEQSDVVDSWNDPLNDGSVLSPTSSSPQDDNFDDGSDDEITESAPSSSLYTGLFSSVFDVAREAVSILNGPSSRYYYQDRQHSDMAAESDLPTSAPQARKPCNTALHLVDTLYLF